MATKENDKGYRMGKVTKAILSGMSYAERGIYKTLMVDAEIQAGTKEKMMMLYDIDKNGRRKGGNKPKDTQVQDAPAVSA